MKRLIIFPKVHTFSGELRCEIGDRWYSRVLAMNHIYLGGSIKLCIPRSGFNMNSQRPNSEDVEQLMLNAQLRDELEPFFDESVDVLNMGRLPTPRENEFLASMLAWERAPVLSISEWFDPKLTLPHPDGLTDDEIYQLLWKTIHRLYEKRIVLEFTDHLSDRELYCVIYRDILPSPEKKVDLPNNYLHWHCLDDNNDPETWLKYYACDHERAMWAAQTQQPLPGSETPPYPRKMPCRPQ